MDIQPKRDYGDFSTVREIYARISKKESARREHIGNLIGKGKLRREAVERMRDQWEAMTYEEKVARVEKLEEICTELIGLHPDYKSFNSAKVYWPILDEDTGEELCVIHWNGTNLSESSGWGMINREIKANDIIIVTQRYMSRVRKWANDEHEFI